MATQPFAASSPEEIRAAMDLSNFLISERASSDKVLPLSPMPNRRKENSTYSLHGMHEGDDLRAHVEAHARYTNDVSAAIADEDEGAAVLRVDVAKREFICANDDFAPCRTGQITKNLSRKVISDHFGRNKSCTRMVTSWLLFCRKHYQRATYKQQQWQRRKVDLISRQLDKIEEQFPGTLYTVAFKKSEERRLNAYARQVAAGVNPDVAAKALEPTKKSKHFEAPIAVLRELATGVGPDQTMAQVKTSIDIIGDMLDKGETAQVPSIEFLPQIKVPDPGPSNDPDNTSDTISGQKTSAVSTNAEAPSRRSAVASRIDLKGKGKAKVP